ncbi:MAG: hypothetical protein ACRES9_01705 [Gammaproteobacteria bacterium]
MTDYFLNLEPIHPKYLIEIIQAQKLPKNGMIWEMYNQISPVDLYCYLYAKYGPPNGMQNFLRKDDSDNLIHWEWALSSDDGLILLQGHNFRSEVHLMGDFRNNGLNLDQLIAQFKSDFARYGKKKKEVRLQLEKWTQFVNPYQRISSAVEEHFGKLLDLKLDPEADKVPQPATYEELAAYGQRWKDIASKYDYAIGLAFGIRSMLPILAESFVNIILFVLGKPEIKANTRLFQDTVRRPIDIRVQSLHINCDHFSKPVDYKSDECKAFHSLMNERNDLLHGNVDPSKLAFDEVFFNGKVPVFTSYGSFWDKSIGVSVKSMRMDELETDYETVKSFVGYLLGCLDTRVRKEMELMASKAHLGFNPSTGRLGILFPEHMVDFRMSGKIA